MNTSNMKELIGKKILNLRINEDQSVLSIEVEHGALNYEAWGDCCSETWFADITGVSALLGGTVNKVEDLNTESYKVDDGRCRQQEDEVYGYKLTTEKGYCDIIFRNSSNGYYGGCIELSDEKGIHPNFKQITDDWRA